MRKLEVCLKNNRYNIIIHNDFSELKSQINSLFKGKKVAIITDDNVGDLYLSDIIKIFEDDSLELFNFTIRHGEESKNAVTLSQIYDFLLNIHLERSDLVIALGGGVIGDVVGYAAATYLRGVDLIQVPTTLLAQVDSSIGGKVAINYRGIKNLIGTFHQPILVYINVKTLKTLPEREFRNGLAEAIVHGVIQDASLIEFIVNHFCNYLDANDDQLEELIYRNCKIKATVVMQDEKDKGLRKILNFGHTIGHAIESLFQYKYTHGECISIGIVAAFKISVFYNLIDEKELKYIKNILNYLCLPIGIENLNYNEVVQKIIFDKKMLLGDPVFILPVKIGRVIDYKVHIDEIPQILQEEE